MLGSAGESEDAVQEAGFDSAAPTFSVVENLRGWLTTVVGCVLRSGFKTAMVRLKPDATNGFDPQNRHGPAEAGRYQRF